MLVCHGLKEKRIWSSRFGLGVERGELEAVLWGAGREAVAGSTAGLLGQRDAAWV